MSRLNVWGRMQEERVAGRREEQTGHYGEEDIHVTNFKHCKFLLEYWSLTRISRESAFCQSSLYFRYFNYLSHLT